MDVTKRLWETWERHAGAGDAARDAFDALITRYQEPHRRYHGIAHLEAVWRDLAAAELRRLGHDDDRIARVRQMILDTKTHSPTSPESVELVDADMAILAADRASYAKYAAATRAEYDMFGDDQWIAGRTAALRRMLDAPIFRAGSPREATARANIEYELQELANGHILG